MTMYALAPGRAPVRCGSIRSPYFISRDAETLEPIDTYSLEGYFKDGTERFEEVLQKLYDVRSTFTREDERHLTFMLESLIHARGEIDAVLGSGQLSM